MNTPTSTERPDDGAFADLFQKLKMVLIPYERHLSVAANTDTLYTLVGTSGNNRAKRFGGVAIRRNHVTFFSCPAVLQQGSPRLQAHRSGTASVSLTAIDESLIRELATLTSKRYQGYQRHGTF